VSSELRPFQPAYNRIAFASGHVCLQLVNQEWMVDRVRGATD
jgi:hypothetical protein